MYYIILLAVCYEIHILNVPPVIMKDILVVLQCMFFLRLDFHRPCTMPKRSCCTQAPLHQRTSKTTKAARKQRSVSAAPTASPRRLAQRRPCTFTAKQRAAILAAESALPPALRCPPIRCVSAHVLARLAEPDGTLKPAVRAWLANPANFELLDAIRWAYVAGMEPHWPLAPKTFRELVHKTLLGLQSTSPLREKSGGCNLES